MKKIICRFDSLQSIDDLKIEGINLDVLEFDLDSMKVLKIKKPKKTSAKSKDKNGCIKNYVGMPEFDSKKIDAFHKIIFHTNKGIEELTETFEQNVTEKTQSVWFPKLVFGKNGKYRVVGGDSKTKYPIYVVSKGRSTMCKTSVYLSQMEVFHTVVVEPNEVLDYEKQLNKNFAKVIELDMSYKENYDTFSNIGDGNGTGPGAARNFCWDHSIKGGHKMHWVMDDNTNEGFHWLYQNNKVKCRTGAFFCAIEDFVDRYDNIAIAGLNYSKFCMETAKSNPFVMNTRIYSYLLIKNDIDYRWRGRYNEDTDLSLRVLKDGLCTVQFNSFLAGKITTQQMKGGNTDEFYDKEGTLNKSKMLEDMHPDVAKVVWRFNRHHHMVDYTGFKQKLNPIVDLSKIEKVNNYGMKIIKTLEEKTDDKKSDLEWVYEELLEDHKQPQFYEY